MTERRDCSLACWQAVLCEELGHSAIRSALSTQLRDDILRRNQILEFFWPAGRELRDRLANCGWIKVGHRQELFLCEPGNLPPEQRLWKHEAEDIVLPAGVCGQF